MLQLNDKNSTDHDKIRDHAWNYFELHAQQRMHLFNFYVVACGLSLTGIGACLVGDGKLRAPGIVLGLLLALVSIVFAKLDRRTSMLVKRAEAVLAEMEAPFPESARLFANEPMATKTAWRDHRVWTYGRSFRVVFTVSGACGFLASMFLIIFRG